MIGTFLIGNWFWIEFHKLSNNQCYFIMLKIKSHYGDIIKSFKSQFFNFMIPVILLYPFKVLITLFKYEKKNHPHKKIYLLIPTLNFLFIKGIIKFFFSFASISSFIKNIIGMFFYAMLLLLLLLLQHIFLWH